MSMIPSVIQAVPMPQQVVKTFFLDGRVVLYDMKPLIHKGGVFKRLEDERFFRQVTVMNDTIAWDLSGTYDPTNCIDVDPCEVYSAGTQETAENTTRE